MKWCIRKPWDDDVDDMMQTSQQVVHKSSDDQVTVIGAGVTLHEALTAAEMLKKGMGCL